MPSELLNFPQVYTVVGLYRLLTDPLIREPVLDKIKHASVRGITVGLIYSAASWKVLDWVVRKFFVGGGWGFGGRRVGEAVGKSVHGVVRVGIGRVGLDVDLVLYTHLLILLPQVSSILRYFVLKNLRIARSRAYALTVASRGKPAEFWSQGYIEEWAQPPTVGPGSSAGKATLSSRQRRHEQVWISWVLWWPVQLVLRHYILLPLSPNLPLLVPLFTSALRSIQTAEYLHQPYFEVKRMNQNEVWLWIEERVWAYRAFGFAASLLESIPIAGLFLSISNRIGAAMWAFDLEKRQHLFANNILKPLRPDQVGIFGMGSAGEAGIDIQAAEDELEKKFSRKKRDDVLDGRGVSGS